MSSVCSCFLFLAAVIEPPYDPTFVVRPRSATVRNGTRTVLECVVNGISKPNIIWMKNENEEVQFDDRVKIAGDGNLLFDPVTIEDTGRYTCHVTEDMVEQALLIVICEFPALSIRTFPAPYRVNPCTLVLSCFIRRRMAFVWELFLLIETFNNHSPQCR